MTWLGHPCCMTGPEIRYQEPRQLAAGSAAPRIPAWAWPLRGRERVGYELIAERIGSQAGPGPSPRPGWSPDSVPVGDTGGGSLVGGPDARHEGDGGRYVDVTGTQPEDVAAALRRRGCPRRARRPGRGNAGSSRRSAAGRWRARRWPRSPRQPGPGPGGPARTARRRPGRSAARRACAPGGRTSRAPRSRARPPRPTARRGRRPRRVPPCSISHSRQPPVTTVPRRASRIPGRSPSRGCRPGPGRDR